MLKQGLTGVEGATCEYVDPANIVYSHTESPYFEDIYYVGEVKAIPINELAREFAHLTEVRLRDIANNNKKNTSRGRIHKSLRDENKVQVLYFQLQNYN